MTEFRHAPYFDEDGDLLAPRPDARGPWSADMLAGRVVSGLLARAIEREFGDPAFQIARLTVDLFRSPPLKPVAATARAVREGNRIRVVDASLSCDGVEVARASAVMLRRGEQPEGQVWRPPDWEMPPPDASDAMPSFSGRPRLQPGEAQPERRRTWTRDRGQLVAGEEQSPFVRVALAADLTNPFANSGTEGLRFINADITLYIDRLPQGDWIGFEVANHQSAAGVAIGACTLYDERGPIGQSAVCALANRPLPAEGQ